MPATVVDMKTAEVESKALFLRGLHSVSDPLYQQLCTIGSMSTKTVETPIASMIGPLEEWSGARTVENLSQDAYTVTAKKYQKTVGIPRDAFDDNTHGTYVAQMQTFGMQVGAWPDQCVAKKLEAGETDKCYDGSAFFATNHQVEHGNAAAGVYANMHGTGGPAWYLFDLSKGVKPLLWLLRSAPEMVQKWSPDDDNVFWNDQFISGVRARGVADYGFPQFAYKCKNALDASNYEQAVEAMMARVNGVGENLGAYPTLLVVPTTLRGDAQRLLEKQFATGGESNTYWKDIKWVTWQRLSNANQA